MNEALHRILTGESLSAQNFYHWLNSGGDGSNAEYHDRQKVADAVHLHDRLVEQLEKLRKHIEWYDPDNYEYVTRQARALLAECEINTADTRQKE